jgi:hypothetical protein
MKCLTLLTFLFAQIAFGKPVLVARVDVGSADETLTPSPDSSGLLIGKREVVDLETMKRKVLPKGWYFSWMPRSKRLLMFQDFVNARTQIGIFDIGQETHQVIDVPTTVLPNFYGYSISSDESKIALSFDDRSLFLLDLKTKEFKTLLRLTSRERRAIPHFTEDPRMLAVDIEPRFDGAIQGKLLNLETSEIIDYPRANMEYAGSTEESFFFSGYFDRNIPYFDRPAGKFKEFSMETISEKRKTKIELSADKKSIKLGTSSLFSEYDQVIVDLSTGSIKPIPNDYVITPDFRYIARVSIDGDKVTTVYRDLRTGTDGLNEAINKKWGPFKTRGSKAYMAPDSKKLVYGVGGYIGFDLLGITAVNILDFITGALSEVEVGETIIKDVKISPDSKLLFYSGSKWGDLDHSDVFMERL